MGMFFSENIAEFVEFQQRHLQVKEDLVASACSNALDLIVSALPRYDRECHFVPEYSGEAVLRAIRRESGRHRLVVILYFLTACVREVTMAASETTSRERDVLDRFKRAEIAADPAWDGWYEFYKDWIFNLLPARLTHAQLAGISQRRIEIAALDAKIKEESALAQELAHDLKAQMRASAAEQIESFTESLKDYGSRIDGYRAELSKLASDYNFVGLSHAFQALIKDKNVESWRYFGAMFLTGLLALSAPIAVAFWLEKGAFDGVMDGAWTALAVAKFVGIVGIEVVLLYFFRISLKSFLLAKDQHANLTLRLALCRFIEGYSDFSLRTKDKGVSVTKGFEDLIFSPLPANDKQIPATIDGMDGIVKIVAALKPGK